MSFSEWSNAKKKKKEEEEKSSLPSSVKTNSVSTGSFTEWSNTKKTGSPISGYNDDDASAGWNAFLESQEDKKKKEEEKSWFEKAIEMMGPSSNIDGPGADIVNVIDAKRNDTSYQEPSDKWSEQQKKDFGFLYNRNQDEAWDYAKRVNTGIAKAEDEKQTTAIKGSSTDGLWKGAAHTAGALATAPFGMADFLDDVTDNIARGEIVEKPGLTPFEYSQTVTSSISEHLNEKHGTLNEDVPIIGGKGWGDVYGLGTSIAQSAIAGYTGGQIGTLVQFFGSAAAAGVDDAKQRGATDDQALQIGALSGVAEGLAEMIGVDKLLNIGSATTMRGLLKNIAKQGAAEGIEEGVTSLMNIFADQWVMKDKSNFNTLVANLMTNGLSEEEAKIKAFWSMAEDVAFDVVAGFASGAAHAGPATALNTFIEGVYQPYQTGKVIMESEGSVDALKQLAQDVAGVSSADMHKTISDQIGKVDGSSALQVGKLYNTVQDANNLANASANQADIAKSLERKGFTAQEAKAAAEALVAQYNGQELTKAQEKTLKSVKGNEAVKGAVSNIMNNAKSTMGQRSDNIRSFNRDVTIGRIAKSTGISQDEVRNIAEGNLTTTANEPVQSHYEASESGETILKSTGEAVEVQEISSIKDGKMTLKLTNGNSVDANDVSYASQGDALVYEAVTNLEGIIDTATANKLSKHLLKLGDVSSNVYANGIVQAYTYGYYGYGRDAMLGEDTLSATLTEKQRNVAYGLGEQYRNARTAAEQEVISKKETTSKKASGKVHFDGDTSKLTERQKTSISTLETVAEALGVQIYVFESEVGENGKRKGANGWYDHKDHSIHIDLYAGANGEGTMLFTAAHELVHYIKRWSPAKFKILADFLMQEYGKKGVSVDMLVHEQIAKAKRNGRTISYDTAYEEVIADSMETMLADGNVTQKLAKLKQQDRTLWEKIKDFISELAKKIREVYKGMTPDSAEGRFVAEMVDSIEKLQELFTEALVDASENYRASEQVLGEAGISVDSKTDAGSIFSVRDVLSEKDRNKVAKALTERFGVTDKEAKEWLKAETSLASLILNPKYSMFLDYEADPNEVAIKQNSDYPQGTVDFSNICKKRREFTQVMNRVLRNFPNHVFAATDLAKIRTIMGEEGMTLPCGICYVEDRRQLDSIVAQDFIIGLKLYREGSITRPDGKPFNANQLKGLKLTDGDDYVPSIYELVTLEGRNSLKAKNPNMEAAWVKYNNARGMQSVRLLTNEAEYKRQILKYNANTVKSKNDKGGLRIYSFSDMEMFHLIDIIQVITDSAAVGLSIQGYTKVNEYAKAVKDTGLKLNRSLIPKGELGYHMENGKVVLDYDTVEGIDIHSKDFFDNRDNPNVGNITIGINDTQIRAAMVSDFVDQIIPFHTGQSEDVLGEKGIATWDNYKDFQTEKDLATGKTAEHQINIYTEVFQAAEAEGKPIQNKKQFVEKFLQVCKENGLKPRFAQFLNTDANGDYVYTEGYHKFLVDFKTFAQTEVGEYLPQMPVKPVFDDGYLTGLMEAYVEEQQVKDAEVARQMPKVIKRITNEIIKPSEVKRSDRDYASQVDEVKNNTHDPNNHVYMGTTPTGISKVLDLPKLPMLITSQHIYSMAVSEKQAKADGRFRSRMNYHDLGWDVVKKLPEYINKPVLIIKANTDPTDATFVVVTAQTDSAGSPIIAAVKPNGKGKYFNIEFPTNIMLSGYGKGGIRGYVARAKTENRILYANKNSQKSKNNPSVQFADSVLSSDYTANLADFKKIVNSKFAGTIFENSGLPKFSDRDTAPTFYSQMAKVVDGVKQEKLGASSVVNMLRGKGVKVEEIKWSGIEEWLAGKKSVTKAELQEFIAGSMLQIEEDMLTDQEIPYSQEQLDQIAKYEAERDTIAENLKSEWKRIVGTDIPITYFGAGLESSVVHNLLEANATKKGNTEAGYKYKAKRAALQRVIEDGDHYFGFDNARQAFREAVRNPNDFMKSYEMTSFEESVFRDFIKAKEAYNKVEGISMQDQKALKAIAESADRFSSRILKVKNEHRAEAAKYLTKYRSYTIKGGTNYRELLFRIPGSTYSNNAMDVHWDRSGVLAHARIQDLNTFLGKMLFIEEIQSDWHNEGHKSGYTSEADVARISELEDEIAQILTEKDNLNQEHDAFLDRYWEEDLSDEEYNQYMSVHRNALIALAHKQRDLEKELYELSVGNDVPDAPFRDTYHEYVLKRLIRMAAEQDYDSIGWTTAQIQSDRWSDEFAEGYRIEYDQDIPKFLNKYGKKWGTRVGKTVLDNGTEVWSMAITDDMKESVLTEGQPLYQDRPDESVSNRSLLANALEGVAQNDIERNRLQEYKGKISLIEAEERKLQKLNDQIKDLSFARGPKDTAKIRELQFEAKQTANRISTYDKQLLRLEASKPLQDVLTREKKMAYQRAERKGKQALADYREKANKRQREIIQRYQESKEKALESREKTAVRHKIQNVVKELNDLLLNESKKRHVPDSLKRAVADALALVNMDTVGAEERAAKYANLIARETDPDKIDAYTATMESILQQGEKMGQRLKELRDAYEEIQNSDDPDIANAYDPVIAGCLQELAGSIGNTSLRNMTLDQLSDVYDMYRMVLTRVRDANKSFLNEKKETISNLASRVVGEVRRVGGEHKHRAAILDPVKKFDWNNLKPVYAFERIGSSTLTEVFNGVRTGEDVWAKDVTEAREYYLDKSKKYGYEGWDFKKKYRFESDSGIPFELTLEQILSLYAYSKREQAHDHLRLGGFVFDSNIETYKDNKLIKYKVNTADAHQITPEILAGIIGELTDKQKGFVDEMQDYLSTTMGAKGNEVTMAMYGVKLFKEKFYFPLKSARQFMFEQNEVSGEVKIKNSGFTNKTVAKANNPVILSNFMDVWTGHVNDMSMYHAFVLPLEDFNRIFNYNSPKKEGQPPVSVKGTIQSAYSPAAVSYVKQLITDLNGGAMSDPRETIAKTMMSQFKKAKVMASMSVVIQQPSAIGRAFALVSPKYFRPTKDGMNHEELWNELKQYAPVAVIKEMGYFDTNMGMSTKDFITANEYSSFKDKTKAVFTDSNHRDEVLSKFPALADELTWCAIWNAVKRETVSTHKDLSPRSEEFLKVAGKRFTEVVSKTQVYDSVLARSANMRSKSGMMNMATSFMAEPTTTINMLEDAIVKRKRGNKGYAAKAFASVATSIVFNNALVAIVYAMRDDDEDETYLEKYLDKFVSSMLDDVNPLTYYPFLKDMWSVLQGYDVERSDMSLVSDVSDSAKKLIKEYTKEDGDIAGAWLELAGTVANIGGIPVQNLRREINAVINFYNTIQKDLNGRKFTPGSVADTLQETVRGTLPVIGWLPGESKTDKLYDAIVSGDTAYVNRLKSGYKDESAVNTAIRTALRGNDPRIKEAAKAKFSGDLDEYLRIAKEIIGEKHFSQDNVVAAINAEINILDTSETSSTSKAKGMFVVADFGTAVAQGDNAMANAIKTDIIRTAQTNGKTAEEAQKSFNSTAKSELKELFQTGEITEQKAISALTSYCGVESEDAKADVQYWAFKQKYPNTYADDSWFDTYYEKVADSGIGIDVYMNYRNSVTEITGEGKKERRMAVIDSLPITSEQKDALYFAEGWTESKLWEAPWH